MCSCQGSARSCGSSPPFEISSTSIDRRGARRRSVGAARIQDPDAAVLLDLWDVRVPVHDGVATRKPRRQPLLPSRARPRDVHEPDPRPADLDHTPLRKRLRERGLVHVPVDRLDRGQRFQLTQNGKRDHVPRVQDPVRAPQLPQALVGQAPRPARQVRVRDDRDSSRTRYLRAPGPLA